MTIFYIILALLLLTVIPGAVSIWFHDFRYKRYLLKDAKKAMLEAQAWKNDVEYFLETLKTEKNITFLFENSYVTYDYQQMNYLFERIVIYLKNYESYVECVKSNELYNIFPPQFHPEINFNAEGIDECITNYVEATKEAQEIRFLRFLHTVRKK